MPENHTCRGLKKDNIFKKLAVERKHYDSSVERTDSVIKTKKYAKVKHFNKRNLPFIAGLFIIVILLSIVVGFYAAFSEVKELSFENITRSKIVTVNQTLSSKISFSQYLQNISYYDKKEIVIQGFLRRHVRGDLTAGVYVESILDDEGNELDLIDFNYKSVPYFPVNGTTNEIYSINGIFKRQYKTLQLQVKGNEPAERKFSDKIEVNKTEFYIETITKTTTVPRYPKIKSLVFAFMGREIKCDDNTTLETCSKNKPDYCTMNGLVEKSSKCGCPDDYNIKDETCERIKRCSDFTIYGECSFDKPKQCIDGVLVDKAQICGCPADYKQIGERCAKIKRCSDGTIYGECARDTLRYCFEGSLVQMASKCGCPNGYYPKEESCISNLEAIELAILKYANFERENHGIAGLEMDSELNAIARAHSESMAADNYFSHVNLHGEDPTDRAKRMHFNRRKDLGNGWYTEGIAENIGKMISGNIVDIGYVNDDPDSIGKAQVESWMQSQGHRENILNGQYSHIGIGVAYDGQYYISTQNFW